MERIGRKGVLEMLRLNEISFYDISQYMVYIIMRNAKNVRLDMNRNNIF